MKKFILLTLVVVLLTGCTKVKEVVEQTSESVVSTNDSLDSTYYPIVSLNPNTGRNEYYNSFNGTAEFQKIGRELEVISTNYFSTDSYYMSDGQVLSYSAMNTDLLKWKNSDRPYSLQLAQDEEVEDKTEIILTSTIYELDFYQKNNDNFILSGMSFGIVIEPLVRLSTGVITYPDVAFSSEFIDSYCNQVIKDFYDYTRESNAFADYLEIPILISTYVKDDETSKYDGGYTLKSYSDGVFGKIDEIDYNHVVFSSSEASVVDPTTSEEFSQFVMIIKNNSVEAVGAVGYGSYRDGTLDTLNITVNANVKTYVEIEYLVGLVASQVDMMFSDVNSVTVKVESQDELEAIIVKNRNQSSVSYMVNY